MSEASVSSIKSTSAKTGRVAKPKKKTPVENMPWDSRSSLNPEEVRQMIATTAYYHAEKRGFVPGGEEDDWLRAEREISQTLAS